MVLVDGLFWYTPCAVVTKVGPLSPSVKSQGPALISCAQGLKIIRFGALTLPKHSDWEYTLSINYPVSSDRRTDIVKVTEKQALRLV